MLKKLKIIGLVLVACAFMLGNKECRSTDPAGYLQSSGVARSHAVQQNVMNNAFDAVPPYQPKDFAARRDINRYLKETESSATWYIYALAMDGRPLFYIVSSMKPRNICISVTSPDRTVFYDGRTTGYVRSAPALDGVYYGGAGCDSYYMVDAATDAYLELSGRTFTLITSKAPIFLETDVKRLEVGKQG